MIQKIPPNAIMPGDVEPAPSLLPGPLRLEMAVPVRVLFYYLWVK